MPLDAKDKLILAKLQENSDRTDREIADDVKISPAAFGARKKRLKTEGYITKIHGILSPDEFGLNTIGFVLIKFVHNSKESDRQFADYVKSVPNVMEIHSTLGAHDAIIKLRSNSIKSLFDTVELISEQTKVSTTTLIVARTSLETTDIEIPGLSREDTNVPNVDE